VSESTVALVAVASNTSSRNIETFAAKLTNPVKWVAASSIGTDQYVLSLIFSSNTVTSGISSSNFSTNDVLTTSNQTGTDTILADPLKGNAVSVANTGGADAQRRTMWAYLQTPSAVSTQDTQIIKVTATAQLP
jgi:hypothetical protein